MRGKAKVIKSILSITVFFEHSPPERKKIALYSFLFNYNTKIPKPRLHIMEP
jgi:hypothetical protein